MKNPFAIAITSALITAVAIKAAPALAEPVPVPQTYVSVVQTGDLNLASQDGQRALQLRLVHAASEVCGYASDSDLKGKNDLRQCRADAIARVAADRDAMLAAAKGGETLAVTASR